MHLDQLNGSALNYLDWLNAFQGFFFVGLPSAEQTTFYSDIRRGIPCNPYMVLDQIVMGFRYSNNRDVQSSNQENLIGTEITPGTFRALEGKKTKTIHRGAYGSFNLLKFHLYENGLIIKEYQLGTSKPIQYEVVNEVEEEFEDGGVRELDGYFEGTKLAFVDYLRPHAIVKKGFKLAFISGAKISKYKGDLSVKKIPTVEIKSKGSVNGSKEAENPNKVTVKHSKDKIIYPSKPHTNKTPGHWEAMVDKAKELANNDNISKVYLNKGLSNEIPGIKPNRRPDIMVVRRDGKIDQYEVPSKTDNIEDLIERMQDNQMLLKDRAGDIFILPPKK
ncbi:hypothetical protein [Psychrobacillus psychrodurans]|uniref:hypothetical protein n=1 Tax=Psychrobacillus psychrodurans TaxID=126157 RepID=UPI0022B9B961|nr:hypothetical protein [Psychrobacillus psychrodurans]